MKTTQEIDNNAGHSDAIAYPIAEGFRRLGVKPTAGYALIKAGELETFTIGARRYVTLAELQRFIRARIEACKTEDRSAKAPGRKRVDLRAPKVEGCA